MNTVFVFPGQGSQIVGMGKDFYDSFPVARETFEAVNNALGYNLGNIIFNGTDAELSMTVNTQPALMTVSMAIVNTLKFYTRQPISGLCSMVAGHSLGEYSALCAAEGLGLEDTAKLLQIRGSSMQEACPTGVGSMVACLGVSPTALEAIINQHGMNDKGSVCQIANDNITGQVVVSGHSTNIDLLIAILKDTGYKAIKLNVSAPFHCNLMKPAEEKMADALGKVHIKKPLVPVVSNITAQKTIEGEEIRQNLVKQVCGRVRWRETIEEFAKLGVEEIVEIGAGRVLTNMIKKVDYGFKLTNIGNVEEYKKYVDSNRNN